MFTEGLSNKLVGFFVDDNKEDIVIVKVFGTNTDNLIDRQAEIETMKVRVSRENPVSWIMADDWWQFIIFKYLWVFCFYFLQILHERQCGAELYATFENGICYQFMNGTTLEVEHCQDPAIYSLVAAEMAKMHSDILTSSSLSNGDSRNGITHHHNNNSKTSHYLSRNHPANHHPFDYNQHQSQIWDKLRQFNKLAEEIMATDPEFRRRCGTHEFLACCYLTYYVNVDLQV